MFQMDYCSCLVALGSDIMNVVARGDDNDAVSWPEIQVLRVIHGPASVTEIKQIYKAETTPAEEKTRLAELYGDELLDKIYPGVNPMMQLEIGSDPARPAKRGPGRPPGPVKVVEPAPVPTPVED